MSYETPLAIEYVTAWKSIYFFEKFLDMETAEPDFLKSLKIEGWKLCLFDSYPDHVAENWKGFVRYKDSFLCIAKKEAKHDKRLVNEAVRLETEAKLEAIPQFFVDKVREGLAKLNIPEDHPIRDFEVFTDGFYSHDEINRLRVDKVREGLAKLNIPEDHLE